MSYRSKENLDLSPPMASSSRSLDSLFDLVIRLRSPEGCPWDREQEVEDLRAYLLEEAHEVAAAIDTGDWDEICTELGDMLFQVVFIVRLAEERSEFTLTDVVARIEQKMIRRHPHVFGDEKLADSAAVHQAWEQRKLDDAASQRRSLLDGLPSSLPALLAAHRMSQKAEGVGFDWPDATAVLDKVAEELAELREELAAPKAIERDPKVREELGDLLFSLANLSRHLGMDAESVLADANAKFRRRFGRMESTLGERGLSLGDLDTDAMEAVWSEAKELEKD
jgi:ATP diphosphatase